MIDFWTNHGFELNVAQSLEQLFVGSTVAQLLRMDTNDILNLLINIDDRNISKQAYHVVLQARDEVRQRTSPELGTRTPVVLNPYFI